MGLLDDAQEYARRSGRNLSLLGDAALDYLSRFSERNDARNAALKANSGAVRATLAGQPVDQETLLNSPLNFGTADLNLAGASGLLAGAVRNVGGELRPPVSTEGMRSVFPQPQRLMSPEEAIPGGRYLELPSKADITGHSPSQARISIDPSGRPSLKVSPERLEESPSKAAGATVRTNLFKQSAGWKWADRADGVPDTSTLISVTTGGKHYYALSTDFPEGVNLSRYAEAPSEPRLRPTSYGDVELGQQVGTITVRGKQHPVYERAVVVPKGRAEAPPEGGLLGSDLSTDPPEIPIGASAATPPEEVVFAGPKAMFEAQAQWKAWGGKGNARVQDNKNGTWSTIREAASASPVPTAPGGNPALAPQVVRPGPVPAQSSVDRRGLPGRPSLRPQSDILHTDPEGRPLYKGSLIAGQRGPGAADTPLTMLEEHQLAGLLGDFNPNARNIGDNGVVTSLAPGVMDPPSPPRLRIEVDSRRPQGDVDQTTRHEGGHALDYWTERTQRGTNTQQQYAIPADVRAELEQASATMRPDLWAPNVDQIYQRSKDVMERYRSRPDELMADGYRYYKENPAEFKAKYPEAAKYIRAMVNDDPLLSGTVQFNAMMGGGSLLTDPLTEALSGLSADDNRKNR